MKPIRIIEERERRLVEDDRLRRLLSLASDKYERERLVTLLDVLPIIVNTLRHIDSGDDIITKRVYYLSFLFYCDPRMLRIQSILDVCSYESIEENKNQIIDYFMKPPHNLRSSEAVCYYESLLADYFVPPDISFFRQNRKKTIIVDDTVSKDELLFYIEENWSFFDNESDIIPKINKKIMSKIMVDFLLHFGFSVKTTAKIIDAVFSDEMNLSDKIKASFTESDIRSQKTYLKKGLRNDIFFLAYDYLEKNCYNNPEELCRAHNSRPFILKFDKENNHFYLMDNQK